MNASQIERRAAWREWRRISRRMQTLRAQIRALPVGPDRDRLLAEQRRLGAERQAALRQYRFSRPLPVSQLPTGEIP